MISRDGIFPRLFWDTKSPKNMIIQTTANGSANAINISSFYCFKKSSVYFTADRVPYFNTLSFMSNSLV